ncbi:MAG: hypothetical protein U0Y10_04735 [Spirosomataceae bacterium]
MREEVGFLNVSLRQKQKIREGICYHLMVSRSQFFWTRKHTVIGDVYEYVSYAEKQVPLGIFYEALEKLKEDGIIEYYSSETYSTITILDESRCFQIGHRYL